MGEGCVIRAAGAWIGGGMAAVLIALAPTPAAADAAAPARLAEAIEQRASRTSFPDLERFGDAAARRDNHESLRRLAHVAGVLLSQSEFDRFDRVNRQLAASARRQGNARFEALAHVNDLRSRRSQGDASVGREAERLARFERDGFVRAHVAALWSRMLMDSGRTGEALSLLRAAEKASPAGDPDAPSAEAAVWEAIGLALMDLNDLEGVARAFERSQVTYAYPAYPRPDFDAIYNMAQVAVQLGDGDLARRLGAAHHRLSVRSNLANLIAWDRNLCAMVAEAFGTPREVLDCMSALDADLTGSEFLALDLLPARAIAQARLSRLAAARADLARFRALRATGKFEPSGFDRDGEVAAEIRAAESPSREAFDALRAYEREHRFRTAKIVYGGVRQVSDSLENQLATAHRETALEHDAVQAQQRLIGLAAALILGAAGAIVMQRRGARRLRAAQQAAEAASRAKTEFLANMSHEIRTPLNGVVGVADMLVGAGLPEREHHMAELIRDSGRSLERLLSDVLDLAKVEAGQMGMEAAPFHAGDLIRATAALLELRAQEKGLAFEATVAPDAELWVRGDAARVRQILVNLLSNAVKFTERGGVSLALEAPAPGVLKFIVRDTGIGFDAEQKARLFGRFQQADGSITRRFGGSGLGLAISRQLAALMGGSLDCESTPGGGAAFWFAAAFAAAEPPAETAAAAPAVAEGRALRVLVADDHPTNQTVVRMMLDSFGIESRCVDDGAQAVAAFAAETFDVVLMDMQMPVMDGLEAIRRIRAAEAETGRPRTPLVMFSANALPEHLEAGRDAGADAHLAKPVTLDRLLATLSAVLQVQDPGDEVALTA